MKTVYPTYLKFEIDTLLVVTFVMKLKTQFGKIGPSSFLRLKISQGVWEKYGHSYGIKILNLIPESGGPKKWSEHNLLKIFLAVFLSIP